MHYKFVCWLERSKLLDIFMLYVKLPIVRNGERKKWAIKIPTTKYFFFLYRERRKKTADILFITKTIFLECFRSVSAFSHNNNKSIRFDLSFAGQFHVSVVQINLTASIAKRMLGLSNVSGWFSGDGFHEKKNCAILFTT